MAHIATAARAAHISAPTSTMLRRLAVALAALIVLSTGVSLAGRWVGHSISMAGHTDDITPYEVVIGNNVIVARANTIRFDRARRDGMAQRLDLYLRWPNLEGYSEAHKDAFNNIGANQSILFLSFEPRLMSRDMSGRLAPIYRALVEPTARPAADGALAYDFKAKSGYSNEEIVVGERTAQEPFVARCLTGESAGTSLAACQRDVELGDNLSLTYRFPKPLLAQWRQLDASVLMTARSMLKTTGDRPVPGS